MISLLYHSHTVVPAHLGELEALGLVEPDEQILVALDGVLLDGNGQRLSGPTLHDYCLVTSLRVLLWARDYGRHLCYAFPLAELIAVEGVGLDPLHAALQLQFAPDESGDEPTFSLTLLPLADLHAALALLRAAAEAAQAMAAQGCEARAAAPEIMAVLSEQIYGHADGPRPQATPYRWPGAEARFSQASAPPAPSFQQDPANLPPGQVYAAGRLARSAWDTLRRSLKETELPFELNGSSLRELTEAVRAINELVHTVSGSPAAQQLAVAFLNRGSKDGKHAQPTRPAPVESTQWQNAEPAQEPAAPEPSLYREIPLRRRGTPAPGPTPLAPARAAEPEPTPDRREIPLRRRVPAPPRPFSQAPAVSGSGDAEGDERGSKRLDQAG
jgi:hypothetical protein